MFFIIIAPLFNRKETFQQSSQNRVFPSVLLDDCLQGGLDSEFQFQHRLSISLNDWLTHVSYQVYWEAAIERNKGQLGGFKYKPGMINMMMMISE